ncbi:helix-turn-helix domain-containing protein [Desulfocurvibacter africanus]|uniref:helix-turn-helix domain-containing protein n=1 Tax=Desulfocurvibacter africanus TaxID=873 RepID=UPI0011835281|nr:helix-turn-helix transcriptional regulator [Desulfocurvibacter africanus]
MDKQAQVIERDLRIEHWLRSNGVDRKQLAARVGCHRSYITRIFKGERAPASIIGKLVEIGVPADLLPNPQKTKRKPGDCQAA